MSAPVTIVMGSASDWSTMEHCLSTLQGLGVEADVRVLSAHRTPDELAEFIRGQSEAGTEVFIAAAGGAAALPGAVAALTSKPVLGVPIQAWALDGLDSLLSMVQMPKGVPVATFAIGKAGAINAAIFAVQVLAASSNGLAAAVVDYRQAQKQAVLAAPDPSQPS